MAFKPKAKPGAVQRMTASGLKFNRVQEAFDAIFKKPPDTKHVDRPGARIVRGRSY